jgi:nucleolar protein 9
MFCLLALRELNLCRALDRRIFLMAALQEISGKERELVTDPDCAGGLERMAYSMDDFVRRVFMDSLTGS